MCLLLEVITFRNINSGFVGSLFGLRIAKNRTKDCKGAFRTLAHMLFSMLFCIYYLREEFVRLGPFAV